MGRRGPNDLQWRKVKEVVKKRDREICRLIRIVGMRDAFELKNRGGSLLRVLDPAHIFAVSTHPSLVYDENNIVTLNRYSHSMLDSGRHPITGDPISKAERQEWWKKIAGNKQWKAIEGDEK